MKKRLALLSFAFIIGFAAVGQAQGQVKYTEYDLDNGLHVILHQDHSSPNIIDRKSVV